MTRKILTIAFALVMAAVPCFAEWTDAELEPNAKITAVEMKQQLREAQTKTVYVREAESDEATAYVDTKKIPALAKMIALNLEPDQMTYVYTNDKKTYKNLASRLRYYAGRYYNFNGYRIITEKEGGKTIDGMEIYRLWVMKVDRPQEVVVYNPTSPVVVDVWGWPWHYHHHHHHGGPGPRPFSGPRPGPHHGGHHRH